MERLLEPDAIFNLKLWGTQGAKEECPKSRYRPEKNPENSGTSVVKRKRAPVELSPTRVSWKQKVFTASYSAAWLRTMMDE